jgi:teichuronic acid biosynthesis glycosyltransferase TuaG
MALVSVIIPTYNRYTFLLRAILSVQRQTHRHLEIIVVNDCSTQQEYYSGQLEEMAQEDPRIKIIHLEQNQRQVYQVSAAQGKTRQHGLNISKGTWIAFLDDDDYWFPKKLEQQLSFLQRYPEYKMCSSNMIVVDIKETPLYFYFSIPIPQTLSRKIIQRVNYINNSTVLIQKALCDQVGEFETGESEDWKYWLRALEYTDCGYIPQPLVYYTRDVQHVSHYSNSNS